MRVAAGRALLSIDRARASRARRRGDRRRRRRSRPARGARRRAGAAPDPRGDRISRARSTRRSRDFASAPRTRSPVVQRRAAAGRRGHGPAASPAQAWPIPRCASGSWRAKPESDPHRDRRVVRAGFGERGRRARAASTRSRGGGRHEPASAEQGARVFATNCSACHSARGQGGQVGPKLDGVGHRAPAELLAKVLAPNRTVAPSFRYETVIMKNGDVFTGVFRREQGVSFAFVDRHGKEINVPKSQIAERRHLAVHADAEQFPGRRSPRRICSISSPIWGHCDRCRTS